MWLRLVAAVLVVVPSPKSQNRLVMVPVELSVKETVSGSWPLAGSPLKLAVGASAPTPTTPLVELPPLTVVKTTKSLKLPAPVGEKRRNMLVELDASRLNAVSVRMLNPDVSGLPTETRPLVIGTSPRLVRTKPACVLVPTTTVPKSRLRGETAS